MASYTYPYDEFARDFDALCPSPNASPRTFPVAMEDARIYFRRTYDHPHFIVRGGAVLASIDFLSEHIDDLDERHTTVRVRPIPGISEHLLRAIYQLVCLAVIKRPGARPSADEVVTLANELALTDSQ
jgi:hypothetical protein